MHFIPPALLSGFVFKTSRSGGKGGQNVNKLATRVQVDFPVATSPLLSEEERGILLEKLGDKLSGDGVLQVVAQASRSQLENKQLAIKKMYQLLNKCFVVRKKRKATKPSKKSVEKRLESKRRDAGIKSMRGKVKV